MCNLEASTEESVAEKTCKESLPIQESYGKESPIDNSSAEGDPGGKTSDEETITNNKGRRSNR